MGRYRVNVGAVWSILNLGNKIITICHSCPLSYGINSIRNPDVVPAQAGDYKEIVSRFKGKP
jgi:hypothetical protein